MSDVSKIKLPDESVLNIKDYRIPGIDTEPISGSDNVVTSGGVYEDIDNKTFVISTALNDLNDRLTEVENSTEFLNDNVGDGSQFVLNEDYDEDQEVIARAINDLNYKKQETLEFDSIPTENSTNPVTSGGVYSTIIENELATSSALNDLNDRVTTIEDDGIIAEPFSEIDPVSIEYYTKQEVDDLLSGIDTEETDPIFSTSPAANITNSDITNWNNKTSNTGTVTQVNVGSTSYNPSNGIVSLPAYPTTLPASDVSAWAKASTKPTYTASEVGALPSTTVIPAAPGTLTTTSTTALSTATNEALSGSISLHKVAKTGTYNDLIGKPTIPAAQVQSDWNATSGMGVILNKPTIPAAVTESTVSGWGFTKNTGTYSKPSGGIPKTDLASAVQTSLGKADTALQSYTETDPIFSASAAAGITNSDITNWNGKTSNTGTITGITMNGASKGTSGVVDLGTVITSHAKHKLTTTNGTATAGGSTITYVESLTGTTTATDGDLSLTATRKSVTIPSEVTESTVSGWGFTKNTGTLTTETDPVFSASAAAGITSSDITNWNNKTSNTGTVTGVKINGTTKNPTSGVVDLGTVLTSYTETDPTVPSWAKATSKPTYTASEVGALPDTTSIPTESTVSGWGFTKNAGTVTGVKINGTTKTPTSGTVDLGTVLTSETALSKGTTTGSGNAVTDISVSGHQITLTKGSTFLTSETSLSKGTTTGSGNAVTDISVSGHQITLTKGTTFLTSHQDISGKANLSGAAFTGTVTGTSSGNTAQFRNVTISSSEPTASDGNNGDIWIVI